MAQALFFNVPAQGHINPTLPVIQELVNRGEAVSYFALEPFKKQIKAAGASFLDYEELPEMAGYRFGTSDDPRTFNLANLAKGLMEYTEKLLPRLLDDARVNTSDYIIHDFSCIWGKIIAEILDLPAIATFPQFPVNLKRRPDRYPGFLPDMISMILTGLPAIISSRRSANRISKAYQVSKPGFFELLANHEELNIVFTSRFFQPYEADFDESFVYVGPAIAARDESINISLEQVRGPLVYVSMGTIFSKNISFYRQCFEAFADRDFQVVVSVGERTNIGEIGAIPDNFVVRNYVPQLELLKQAEVFITHGGMNSVSEALWHEVPLIVVPQAADQYMVAQRVEALDAGLILDKRKLSAKLLREAVEKVVRDQAMVANARAVGKSFRKAGGASRAVDDILQFTRAAAIPEPPDGKI